MNEQVFIKLMRRYKYLEKMFEEEMKKVLVFIKGFSPQERIKLARMTALWISNSSVPPTVLSVLINEHLVKDNLALDFLLEVFVTWKQEKGLSSLMTALKKGGIEGRYIKILNSTKNYKCDFCKLSSSFQNESNTEKNNKYKFYINCQYTIIQSDAITSAILNIS